MGRKLRVLNCGRRSRSVNSSLPTVLVRFCAGLVVTFPTTTPPSTALRMLVLLLPRESNPVPDFKSSGTYQEDQAAAMFNSINDCMITPMYATDNFSPSGGASHTDRLSCEISKGASGLADKANPYIVVRALSGLVSSPSSSSKRRRK